MNFNQQKLYRRSIRLKGFDYTQPGANCITIVTSQREEIYGEISNGEMRFDQLGEIVRTEWLKTADIRSNIELHEHEFVIMPNHLHGIIWIVDKQVGATPAALSRCPSGKRPSRSILSPHGDSHWGAWGGRVAPAKGSRTLEAGSIGAIMAQFKSITTKRINALRAAPGIPDWQRNYFEHIIRDEIEFGTIRNYPHSTSIILKTDKTHAFSLKTYGCCQDRHSNPTLIHTLEYRSLK